MNPGQEAIQKLAAMGYRFTVNGETIKAKYEGQGGPDPAQVRPLFEVVKANKPEALYFLKCHCPRCGGVATCPDYEGGPLCLACDWDELARLYPAMAGAKH